VDAVVQSTDKNFMVPVGGSIVAGGPGQAGFIEAVNAAYPGRASATPMLDLLVTLLHWGAFGWQKVLQVEFRSKHGFSACPALLQCPTPVVRRLLQVIPVSDLLLVLLHQNEEVSDLLLIFLHQKPLNHGLPKC
jgi:hypothetical protein